VFFYETKVGPLGPAFSFCGQRTSNHSAFCCQSPSKKIHLNSAPIVCDAMKNPLANWFLEYQDCLIGQESQ
jgi:hypothetical protein